MRKSVPAHKCLARWLARRSPLAALLCMATGLAVFTLAYLSLHERLGPSMATFAILPVVLVAWLFGAKVGLAMGVAATALALGLMAGVGSGDLPYILHGGGAVGLGVLVAMGGVVGSVIDLRQRVERDLAGRREAEERLARERRLLRTVIDNLPLAVYAKDLQGRKILTNPVDLAWMGAEDESVFLGKTDAELFPERAEQFTAEDTQILESRRPIIDCEGWLKDPQGEQRFTLASKLPLLGPDGEMLGIVGVTQDVTERRLAEEALRESEERFRRIVEMSGEGVVEEDAHGGLAYVNARMAEILGYTPQEMIGEPAVRFVPFDELDAHKEMQLHRRQGLSDSYERRLVRKDGGQVWVHVTATPTLDGEGAYAGSFAMVRDITEEKHATLALRDSERRLRRLAESAAAILWQYDIDSDRWTYVAPQAAEILGYPPEDWADMAFWTGILHPEDREWATQYCVECTAEGRDHEFEYRMIAADGRIVWIRDVVSVEMRDSQPTMLHGFMLDVTERKEAEEALRESEDRYRRLAENAPDLIYRYRLEPQRGFTYVSPAATVITGYTPEEHYADPNLGYKLVHPDDRPLLDAATSGNTPDGAPLTLRWVRKDGQVIWTEQRNVMIHDEDGEPVAIEGIARDVTERKRAEAALAQERQLLRTVIDNLPASVYVKDLEGRKTLANRHNLKLLGATSEEEVLGKTDHDFYAPEAAARFVANDRQVLSTGEPILDREQYHVHKGMPRWVLTSKLPLHDEAGVVAGLVGITYDITERKAAEQRRLDTERQLLHTQKLESLGVLAGGVAHDFGNLLMAILGNLTLALPDLPADSPAHSSIQLAMQAGQRAADVARQMLTYSGRGQVQPQPLSLSEVVHENAHMLRVAIPKNVTLDLELANDLPRIMADPGQIQQVLINLITNAAEAIATEPGCIQLRTGMRTCDDRYLSRSMLQNRPPAGEYVYLEVKDTGCGIAPGTLHRILEPFYTTKSSGRGLGMAAVQGIVTSHTGAILADSVVGQGTTVRVLFPVAQERSSGELQPAADHAIARQPASPRRASNGHATVLVVDDEEIVRQAAERMLHRLGYRTLAAENGEKALDVYREHVGEIDCVLLDLTMPRMDGASAYAALHSLDPDLPVVLCSGYSQHELGAGLDRDSLAGFLQKPYSMELLSETIQGALGEIVP